ncbi:MAG: DUF3419 family protein [Gammaproteobacteria bacterium]|nr:DUF3419 family protein [Gammaproteobacteria bacterium]
MCRPYFRIPGVSWLLFRQFTMNMAGVPRQQPEEYERAHVDAIAGSIRDAVAYVFRHRPLPCDYFRRVCPGGRNSPECCPERLKKDNFPRLGNGLVDDIKPYTGSLTGMPRRGGRSVSRFVLLETLRFYPEPAARPASGGRVQIRAGFHIADPQAARA